MSKAKPTMKMTENFISEEENFERDMRKGRRDLLNRISSILKHLRDNEVGCLMRAKNPNEYFELIAYLERDWDRIYGTTRIDLI